MSGAQEAGAEGVEVVGARGTCAGGPPGIQWAPCISHANPRGPGMGCCAAFQLPVWSSLCPSLDLSLLSKGSISAFLGVMALGGGGVVLPGVRVSFTATCHPAHDCVSPSLFLLSHLSSICHSEPGVAAPPPSNIQ